MLDRRLNEGDALRAALHNFHPVNLARCEASRRLLELGEKRLDLVVCEALDDVGPSFVVLKASTFKCRRFARAAMDERRASPWKLESRSVRDRRHRERTSSDMREEAGRREEGGDRADASESHDARECCH